MWNIIYSDEYFILIINEAPGLIQFLFLWDLGRQTITSVGILQVLRVPLPLLILPTAPHELTISSPTLYSLDTEGVVK
jgi:hypothetical protein